MMNSPKVIFNIEKTNPVIEVITGDKNKNYNHINPYVKTSYSDDIYKGIIIKYQDRIYDYSINERDVWLVSVMWDEIAKDLMKDINEENNVFSIGKVINITGSMIEVAGLKDVAFFESVSILNKAKGYV